MPATARGSSYREQVGERIRHRAERLGLSQIDLAERTGVSYRQVGNVMRGVTGMTPTNRPAWERALRWPAGSLSAAYERGILPDVDYGLGPPTPPGRPADAAGGDLMDEAGVPKRLRNDPIVAQIIAGPFDDTQKIHMLRDWSTAQLASSRVRAQLASVTNGVRQSAG